MRSNPGLEPSNEASDLRSSEQTRTRVKSVSASALMSPWTYVGLILISSSLLKLESPLNWGSQFSGTVNQAVLVSFVGILTAGIWIGNILSKIKLSNIPRASSRIDQRWLRNLFVLATLFYLAKFVNIGDIPLFGDSQSRYQLTVGGFADFTSRLITPLALLYFASFIKSRDRKDLVPVGIACALHTLLMQRQEVLYVLAGCLIILLAHRRLRLKTVFTTAVIMSVTTYIVVGLGAVARYGSSQISTRVSGFELPLWIIHGELTLPYKLGAVVSSVVSGKLQGRYSLGTYFTLTGSDPLIAAEYVNQKFVGADTAQSIAAPFSYIADFGMLGLLFLGLLTGVALGLTYAMFRSNSDDPIVTVAYPLLLLGSFWSVRSGVFPIDPLFVYSMLTLIAVTSGGSPWLSSLRPVLRMYLCAFILLSGLTLAIRI